MHRFIAFANNTRAFEGLLFIAKYRFSRIHCVWRTTGAQYCGAIYSRNVRINVYSAAREFCFDKAALEALTAQISRRIFLYVADGATQNFNNVKQNKIRYIFMSTAPSDGRIKRNFRIEPELDASKTTRLSDAGFTGRFDREAKL